MMIVDLTTVKDTQTFFDFSLDPSEIELESESAKLKNDVEVQGKVRRGIVQADVEGKIQTNVEVECIRCLGAVEKSLDFDFKAAFIAPEHYTREKEAEINAQDLEVSIFEGDKIDLKELVREQILLNLPEQVLCREDCTGLCQKCSANRNLIDCSCEEKEIDPRWHGLRDIKIKN